MGKKVSSKEMKKIIEKVTAQYEEYSKKYGESFFSLINFKDRYMEALNRGMDLQAFAFAEIGFLEKLKEKWDNQQEEHRIRAEKPFTKKIEKYLEELEKKWQKYPALFSSELPDEAQFFCGALQELYSRYWFNLSGLIEKDDLPELKEYNILTGLIQKFVISTKNSPPFHVENYMFNCQKYGIEKCHMIFLKEGAALLKKIRHFLKSIKERAEQPIPALEDAREYLEQVIQDFRFMNLI